MILAICDRVRVVPFGRFSGAGQGLNGNFAVTSAGACNIIESNSDHGFRRSYYRAGQPVIVVRGDSLR